jgi:hypothetical protein
MSAVVPKFPSVNLTPAQITDLTDAGDSTLHYHATDRARANHTGTQAAATISDFTSAVAATALLKASNLSDVASPATAASNIGVGTEDSPTFAGATLTGNLILPKASGKGIKTEGDTYPWYDLLGQIFPKSSGAGSPTLDTISGNLRGFRYSAGDDGDFIFHLPHDYAPGSDLYFHMHWLHNGTNISGSLVITLYASYAKGHQQASFPAEITTTITESGLTLLNTPALWHRIPEIQLSTPGGSASLLNTSNLEPDGVIMIHYDTTTIPSITGGSGEPFYLVGDIHYQSTNVGTKQKAPNFYV